MTIYQNHGMRNLPQLIYPHTDLTHLYSYGLDVGYLIGVDD